MTSILQSNWLRGLISDIAALFSNLTFGFMNGLLACSMLAWLAV